MLRRSSAELHHLLTILRATVTQGTTGQPVKTWTTLDTIWGEIVPQLQAEVMEEKQIQALGLYLVTIRYYQGNGAASSDGSTRVEREHVIYRVRPNRGRSPVLATVHLQIGAVALNIEVSTITLLGVVSA